MNIAVENFVNYEHTRRFSKLSRLSGDLYKMPFLTRLKGTAVQYSGNVWRVEHSSLVQIPENSDLLQLCRSTVSKRKLPGDTFQFLRIYRTRAQPSDVGPTQANLKQLVVIQWKPRRRKKIKQSKLFSRALQKHDCNLTTGGPENFSCRCYEKYK